MLPGTDGLEGFKTDVKGAAGNFDGPPGFEGARGAQLLIMRYDLTGTQVRNAPKIPEGQGDGRRGGEHGYE